MRSSSSTTRPRSGRAAEKLYNLGVPKTAATTSSPLGTGIPKLNFTGSPFVDGPRVNLAVPVTPAANPNRMGVLGGDNAGFPNGRRLGDDMVDIAEQVVAGASGHTVPLGDGVDANEEANLTVPVRGAPYQGYENAKDDVPEEDFAAKTRSRRRTGRWRPPRACSCGGGSRRGRHMTIRDCSLSPP